ncbi:unnamed protein product [Symbiodinium pilosum]|uniref:protein-ribulosamine 3-kinase n=1 Tax=Symbiodinium pilosum TaxID=2952 RepID=A0A812UDV1_SYMPI|nr:unnamed protein product [Symbiodinium pilosum]
MARSWCLFLVVAGFVAVPPSFVTPLSGSQSSSRRTLSTHRRKLTRSALADELISWAEAAGYVPNEAPKSLGGSEWAQFHRLKTETADFFVKSSSRAASKMFVGEAEGLRALGHAAAREGLLRVPKVHHVGDREDGAGSFIVMEYLELGGPRNSLELGRAMASLHAQKESDRFGFEVDNTKLDG